MPTLIARPTRSSTSRRNFVAILDRCPRDLGQAAHLEERLVDRQAFDERRGVLEHLEHSFARVDVRGEVRFDDDGPRAQPTRLAAAHRGADTERLGLVARREHDSAADDNGPPPQVRRVALLDGRVEGVEVGMQDRRVAGSRRHL